MKNVYVVERNGTIKASDPELQMYATVFTSRRGVEAWNAITPLPVLEVERCVPYVSVDELDALPNKSPELVALIEAAKAGVTLKPSKVVPIPTTLKEGTAVYLYKGDNRRYGRVRLRAINRVATPYVMWTDGTTFRGSELPSLLATNMVAVSNFLNYMRTAGAQYDGLETFRIPV